MRIIFLLFFASFCCFSIAQHNPYLKQIELTPSNSPARDTGFFDCGDTLAATFTFGINGSSIADYSVCGSGLQIKMYVNNARFLNSEDASANLIFGPEFIGLFSYDFAGPDTIVATQVLAIPYSFFTPFEATIQTAVQVLPTADLGQSIHIGATLIVQPDNQICFGNDAADDVMDTVLTVFCLQSLPLQSFDLQVKLQDPNQSKITWKVLQQINYMEFEIERKKDTEFNWTSIATIPAISYSENETVYHYIDQLQGSANKVFYRIKVISQDGSSVYSPTRMVFLNTQARHIQLFGYPNPTHNFYELNIQSKKEEKIILQLFDMLGRTVSKETILLQDGLNIKWLDLTHLLPGTYVIKAAGLDIQEKISIIKTE